MRYVVLFFSLVTALGAPCVAQTTAPAPSPPPPSSTRPAEHFEGRPLRDPTEAGPVMKAVIQPATQPLALPTMTLRAIVAVEGNEPQIILEIDGQIWRAKKSESVTLANGQVWTVSEIDGRQVRIVCLADGKAVILQ